VDGLRVLIFAFLSYLVYAGTESKPLRRLAGGLFIVSAGSFYGSIFTSAADMGIMLLWAVILSVLVVVVLLGVYVMAREAEAPRPASPDAASPIGTAVGPHHRPTSPCSSAPVKWTCPSLVYGPPTRHAPSVGWREPSDRRLPQRSVCAGKGLGFTPGPGGRATAGLQWVSATSVPSNFFLQAGREFLHPLRGAPDDRAPCPITRFSNSKPQLLDRLPCCFGPRCTGRPWCQPAFVVHGVPGDQEGAGRVDRRCSRSCGPA